MKLSDFKDKIKECVVNFDQACKNTLLAMQNLISNSNKKDFMGADLAEKEANTQANNMNATILEIKGLINEAYKLEESEADIDRITAHYKKLVTKLNGIKEVLSEALYIYSCEGNSFDIANSSNRKSFTRMEELIGRYSKDKKTVVIKPNNSENIKTDLSV